MIFVEDNAHVVLLRTIGISIKQIKKAGDKYRVCRFVEKNTQKCLGLIDEDSTKQNPQPTFLKTLKLKDYHHNIKIYVDIQNWKKIIILCPVELEDWVLSACKASGIDAKKDFGLENSPKELHRVINLRLKQVENLIKCLIELENPAILHLKQILIH